MRRGPPRDAAPDRPRTRDKHGCLRMSGPENRPGSLRLTSRRQGIQAHPEQSSEDHGCRADRSVFPAQLLLIGCSPYLGVYSSFPKRSTSDEGIRQRSLATPAKLQHRDRQRIREAFALPRQPHTFAIILNNVVLDPVNQFVAVQLNKVEARLLVKLLPIDAVAAP